MGETGPTGAGAPTLSERERAILAFERERWAADGAKERAIRARFDLSAARYHQLLGRLIDSPAALRYDPMLVKRLRRLRRARTSARAERVLRLRDHEEAVHGE